MAFFEGSSTCQDRPYLADAGPDNPRHFIFSPDVGLSIQGLDARMSTDKNEVESVKRFGRGYVDIKDVALEKEASCPHIEWIKFSVRVEGGF